MKKKLLLLPILSLFIFLSGTRLYAQTTYNVPGDYPTIQAAITAATAGDIIEVDAGNYPDNFTINKAITVRGPNHDKLGNDPSRVAEAVLDQASIAISGSGANGSVLEGFKIVRSNSTASIGGTNGAVWLAGNNNGIVRNNYFLKEGTGNGIEAIIVSGGSGAPTIEGNYFHSTSSINARLWQRGIYVVGSNPTKIYNNTFGKCRTALTLDAHHNNLEVDGNTFEGSSGTIMSFGGGYGGTKVWGANEISGSKSGTALFNFANVAASLRWDISDFTWNGVQAKDMTLTQRFSLEGRIQHHGNNSKNHFVIYHKDHGYVTGSGAGNTIQSVLNYAEAGYTIYVNSGNRTEEVTIPNLANLTLLGLQYDTDVSGRTNATANSETRVQAPNGGYAAFTTTTAGAQNLTIKGFSIRGANGGAGIDVKGNVSGMHVENNLFSGFANRLSFAPSAGSQNVTFTGNRVMNSFGGPYFPNSSTGIVSHNIIDGMDEAGVTMEGSGNEVVIHNNIITNNEMGIWVLSQADAGGSNPLSANTLVSENNLTGNNIFFKNERTSTLETECNWFGTADFPDASEVVGDVNVPNFLEGGGNSASAGFMPTADCVACANASVTNQNNGFTYCSIQEAIDSPDTENGHTLIVSEGEYYESVVINKSLTLLGANAGTDGNDINRVDETVIYPTGNIGINIKADHVTIDGFRINGANPNDPGYEIVNTGEESNTILGIYHVETGKNNLIVQNNIIENMIYAAVMISPTTQAQTAGHRVKNNLIQNLGSDDPVAGYVGFGNGTIIGYHSYTAITDNTMKNVNVGIQTENWHQPNPNNDLADQLWARNTIEARGVGIYYNTTWGDADPFRIEENTITGIEVLPGWNPKSRFVGIVFSSLYDGGSGNNSGLPFTGIEAVDNIISGGASNATGYTAGYEVWNVSEATTPLITGGSVSDVEIGVYVNNYSVYGDAPRGAHVSLENIELNNISEAGIKVLDNPGSNHADVHLNIGEDIVIKNSENGVIVENSNASVSDYAENLSFENINSNYWELINNENDIDARGTSYEGTPVANMTAAYIDTNIDSKIIDELDDASLGFVLLYYSVYNVDQNKYYLSIHAAVADADQGDHLELLTDVIETQQSNINKQVHIDGKGFSVDFEAMGTNLNNSFLFFVHGGNAAGTTIQNITLNKTDQANQNIIGIQSNNVTLDNVTVTANWQSGDSEVVRAVEVSGGLTGLSIKNSSFSGVRQAAYVNDNTQGEILNNAVNHGWVVVSNTQLNFEGNTKYGGGGARISIIQGNNSVNWYDCDVMAQIEADNVDVNLTNALLDTASCKVVYNVEQNKYYPSIHAAVADAASGEHIELLANVTETQQSNINKQVHIDGKGFSVDFEAMGTNLNNSFLFFVHGGNATGTTIQNITLNKTDHNEQNIIGIQSNNVTIDDVTVIANWQSGDSEVVRAVEVSGGLTGLSIKNSSFSGVRQAAYVNDNTQGEILNNAVNHGWVVVSNTQLNFAGNTLYGGGGARISIIQGNNNVNWYDCDVMAQIEADNVDVNLTNALLDPQTCLPVWNIDQNTYYMTIQEGVDDANAGETLQLSEHVFKEQVVINKSLTIQGDPNNDNTKAVMNGQGIGGSNAGRVAITIKSNVQNVTLKNFTIERYTGNNGLSAAVYANPNTNGLLIEDMVIKNNSSTAGVILVGNIDGVTIQNNQMTGNSSRNIYALDGARNNVSITGNTFSGGSIDLNDGSASGLLIDNNTISSTATGIVVIGLKDGSGQSKANIISNNTLSGISSDGIRIINPNGTGSNDETEDGAIIIKDNSVTGTNASFFSGTNRAGIAVFRNWVLHDNPDIPVGVYLDDNTVNNYSGTRNFGILIEGNNHTLVNNDASGNTVDIQLQAGNSGYPGSLNSWTTLNNQFYGWGNAPETCNNDLVGNIGNVRYVYGSTDGMVENVDTGIFYCSIQAAIDAGETLDGHEILVRDGMYNENVSIYKNLNIHSENGPGSTSIEPDSGRSVAIMGNTHNLADITLEGFTLKSGGAGAVNLISLSQADGPAGYDVVGLNLKDLVIDGNGDNYGVGLFDVENAHIENVQVSNAISGFGMSGVKDLLMDNVEVIGVTAAEGVSISYNATYAENQNITIINSTFDGNKKGMDIRGNQGDLILTDNIIKNSPGTGGYGVLLGNPADAVNVTFTGNQVEGNGGVGFYVDANGNAAYTLDVSQNTFDGNRKGVGIEDNGAGSTASIENNIFHNHANNAVENFIAGTVITNNSFVGNGGSDVSSSQPVNADCNWWDSTLYDTIEGFVSAGVTFQPWLADGGNSAAIGFTPTAACDNTAPDLEEALPDDCISGEVTFVFDFEDDGEMAYLELDIFRPGDDQSSKIQLTLPADNAVIQAFLTANPDLYDDYGVLGANYDASEQKWTITVNTAIKDANDDLIWPDGITKFYMEAADTAGNKYGDMNNDPQWGGTQFVEFNIDNTAPVLVEVLPVIGDICLNGDTFKWSVQASDPNLVSLEVDHSLENNPNLPEFTVYADEANPWGSQAALDWANTLQVSLAYDADDQIWEFDFGPTVTSEFVNNGSITFYTVLKDCAGNELGSMDPTAPSNTFTYSFDTEKPVITLLGDANISVCEGDTYTDAGATANDNCDGDITGDITVVNNVDTSVPGTYTITYNVDDSAGNQAVEVTRTVKVIANPVFTVEVNGNNWADGDPVSLCYGSEVTIEVLGNNGDTFVIRKGTFPVYSGTIGTTAPYLGPVNNHATAGTYFVDVTTADGTHTCTTTWTGVVTVNVTLDTPIVNVEAQTCLEDGTANITNYNSAYTYTFDPIGPSVDNSGNITGVVPGTEYTVFAKDAGGCESLASASFKVTAKDDCPANVSITKTVDDAEPLMGGQVKFTITIKNEGGAGFGNASNVVVTDQIPSGYSNAAVTGGTSPLPGSVSWITSHEFEWNVGSLNVNEEIYVEITADVEITGNYDNTGKVTGNGDDSSTFNETHTVVVTPKEAVSLVITKGVDNPIPTVDDVVFFTVKVTNNGPNDATNIVVNDVLPAGYGGNSGVFPDVGTYEASTGDWEIPTLANGATATLLMWAQVLPDGSTEDYLNIAEITGVDQVNTNAANNSAEQGITLIKLPDLSPAITVSPASGFTNGQELTFLLEIKEVAGVDADVSQPIIITIAKSANLINIDSNWWNDYANITSIAGLGSSGNNLDNANWDFEETLFFYKWTYTGTEFTQYNNSKIGFKAIWDAGVSGGATTFTVVIQGASGGEINSDNNSSTFEIIYDSSL